jgi:hypothetical protein
MLFSLHSAAPAAIQLHRTCASYQCPVNVDIVDFDIKKRIVGLRLRKSGNEIHVAPEMDLTTESNIAASVELSRFVISKYDQFRV